MPNSGEEPRLLCRALAAQRAARRAGADRGDPAGATTQSRRDRAAGAAAGAAGQRSATCASFCGAMPGKKGSSRKRRTDARCRTLTNCWSGCGAATCLAGSRARERRLPRTAFRLPDGAADDSRHHRPADSGCRRALAADRLQDGGGRRIIHRLRQLEDHARRYHLQAGVYAAAVRELVGIAPIAYIHYIRYARTVMIHENDVADGADRNLKRLSGT